MIQNIESKVNNLGVLFFLYGIIMLIGIMVFLLGGRKNL